VLACAVYLPGAFLGVDYLNGTALVLTLLAAAALFGGMPALRWAWLPVAFLMFMIPLPFRVANGLSLFVFQALAVGVAILISRPWPDRAAVVLSAVPIAIAANVVRITLTTRAYGWFGEKLGDLIFHDLSGWQMMPVAVGMLWLVLKLIDVVWVPIRQGEEGHHPLGPGFVLNPTAPGA
jgi:exosortase/archaeosortase family protein